jgi:hypothetical protein
MPPTSPTFDYGIYRQRLEDLCTRLRQANIRVDSTRLDSYRKTFAKVEKIISEGRVRQLPDEVDFETLLNDLEESQEILEACDQFSDLSKPGLRDRLEKVLSGQRELAKESLAKAEARNVLFELVMAARIGRAGFVVDLDRIEDVFFDLFGRPCFVECKRVHSANKLRARIEEAAKQIGRRCDDSRSAKARGLIALDVSKIENPRTFLLPCQTENQVLQEIKQHLQAFVTLHRSGAAISRPPRKARAWNLCLFASARRHRATDRIFDRQERHDLLLTSFTIPRWPAYLEVS